MDSQKIKQFFDPYFELDIQTWRNFEKFGTIKTFPKESVLKPSHTTEKHLNLILEGCGGNLIWSKNNFVCIDLSFENDFLTDYMSFTQQAPSAIEVRLFEKTTLFQIPYPHFQQILSTGKFGEKMTRLIAEQSFIEKQQQQIDLLTKTAKERYLGLWKKNPGIERIPLKYLASYLGITPQSLSRIRGQKI